MRGAVVVAPFPFSDIRHAKPRPLVIIGTSKALGAHPPQYLCAMITSTKSRWSSDIEIRDTAAAGLHLPCCIRLKLFTLDERLLARRIGQLSKRDTQALNTSLRKGLAL